jgi:RHS repeat-associated protein
VTLDGVVVEEFTYDDNGNRLTGYQQGEGTKAGVYDAQDRLISYGDLVYTYTENGELETKLDTVTGDEWSYEYDVFGNLLSVALPDGRLVAYITDGRHRRVGKMIDGVMVRQWLFEDQLNPVAELDGDGNLLWQYVYASRAHSPDFVVNASGEVYRVISDQLGSPRLIVNVADDTDVLLEAEYTAFGERSVIAGDGSALSVGFAGGEFDVDSGLTRFGARDYDARVGRWVSKDPIGWEGGQVNLYVYVNNDDVNSSDPSGTGPYEFFGCLLSGADSGVCVHDEVRSLCGGPIGDLVCSSPDPLCEDGPGPPPRPREICRLVNETDVSCVYICKPSNTLHVAGRPHSPASSTFPANDVCPRTVPGP